MLCDFPLHNNLIQNYTNKTLFTKYINLFAKLLVNSIFMLHDKLYSSVTLYKQLKDKRTLNTKFYPLRI